MTETGANGRQLTKEHGWMPGLELKANYQLRDWQFGVAGEAYGGDIRYDGRLQNGVPFSSDTATRQSRVGVEIGHRITEAARLIGVIEYDFWRRNIHGRGSVLGMNERYTSWRLLTGAETRFGQWSAASVSFKSLLVLARPERLRVRFDRQLFDDADFSTKPAIGARLEWGLQPAAFPNLSFEADFDWLRIRRSDNAVLRRNGAAVGTVAQPEHQRTALGIRANYRF
jgi:hypothetical protein